MIAATAGRPGQGFLERVSGGPIMCPAIVAVRALERGGMPPL